MASPRRCGYISPASFDIIDFYIDSLSSQLEPVSASEHQVNQQPRHAADDCSRSSSVYSTDTPPGEPTAASLDATPRNSACGASLQQVFRSLCQASLHIANLRHARSETYASLEKAEERVDSLARGFLLKRLGSIDHVDSSNHAIDKMTNILMGDEGQDRMQSGSEQETPEDADVAALQEAVRHAKELKAAWHRCRRRLEAEQRVLLWPTLEQWRLAVASQWPRHGTAGQETRSDSQGLASPSSVDVVSSLDRLDRLTRETEQALPRMGRQRLEHLLRCVTAALQSSDGESLCMPEFI